MDKREAVARAIAEHHGCHARHAGVPCTVTIGCSCATAADVAIAAYEAWDREQERARLYRMVDSMPDLPDGVELVVSP